MRIRVDRKKCSGCRLCEMVCSLFHMGVMNTERSAIRVEKDDLETSVHRPVVCRRCKETKCLEGEAVDAKTEQEKFLWDAGRGASCPFRALRVFQGDAYHCDLCGGSPQCVKVCTPGALGIKRGSSTG
jgi:Fe-S-cluster-containing hydrogenase component 2